LKELQTLAEALEAGSKAPNSDEIRLDSLIFKRPRPASKRLPNVKPVVPMMPRARGPLHTIDPIPAKSIRWRKEKPCINVREKLTNDSRTPWLDCHQYRVKPLVLNDA
jgi:hypothetical protein